MKLFSARELAKQAGCSDDLVYTLAAKKVIVPAYTMNRRMFFGPDQITKVKEHTKSKPGQLPKTTTAAISYNKQLAEINQKLDILIKGFGFGGEKKE